MTEKSTSPAVSEKLPDLRRRRRTDSAERARLDYGKVPPQAVELEEAVLGALMIERDALTEVIDILHPESFYKEPHRHIFKAILNLFQQSKPVDILTVTEALRQEGTLELAGGAYYITELSNKVASSAHIEHHAHIISQKFIQRELIRISSEIIKDAYEDTTDVFEMLDKAERSLFEITDSNLRRGAEGMDNLTKKVIDQIDKIQKQEGELTGIGSGFQDMDRITNGWQASDLVIIAARPGMGKTAFTLSTACNAAVMFKKPVAVFSLEMSAEQLTTRLIAAQTGLPINKLKRGDLADHEWQQLRSKIGPLENANIIIDDTPAINIFELRAKCRRLKSKHDVEMIIIDYLQLMSGTGDNKYGNREQEISNISRSLKSIAKELDIPVIALSQLSRAVETRGGDRRPQLADLRESGAIEQDADLVLFLYRPEYYNIEQDAEGNSTEGMAEIIVAKHRNGSMGSVELRFVKEYAKFMSLDKHDLTEFAGESTGQQNVITRGSKMNEMDNPPPDDPDSEEPGDPNEKPPF